MADPDRVLILAPNWLGDAVMSFPALAGLRRRWESAELIVAARRSVADLFRLTPFVDDVRVLRWGGRPLRPRGLLEDVAALRGLGADVAILFPNSFASALLVQAARVPARWGYATDGRARLLSEAVSRPGEPMHQERYYRQLVDRAGRTESTPEATAAMPALAVPEAVAASARRMMSEGGWDGERPLLIVAPGAAYGSAKRWPPTHFARAITELIDRRGLTCVLVGGKEDAATTGAVRAAVDPAQRDKVMDLAGRTTLPELGALLSMASACVSNDSGAMHLAGALSVPLVALFGPTNERETAPLLGPGGRVELLTHDVPCRPCMLRECPIGHPCMNGLGPDRVVSAVESVMA